jgi:Flp pilus assembly protein CpaB
MALAQAAARPQTLAAWRPSPRGLAGVALALLGVAIVFAVAHSEQPRTVEVVRVARDVPAGTVLRPEDLRVVSEALPDDVATGLVAGSERAGLIGQTLTEPLHSGDLLSRKQAVPAARQIPAGQRVYVLPIPQELADSGQLHAGSHVDVLVTLHQGEAGGGGTRTVLRGAPVYLTSRQDSGGSGSFGVTDRVGATRGPWLAVLVDRTQEEALANARRSGDLDVALVGPEEQP